MLYWGPKGILYYIENYLGIVLGNIGCTGFPRHVGAERHGPSYKCMDLLQRLPGPASFAILCWDHHNPDEKMQDYKKGQILRAHI